MLASFQVHPFPAICFTRGIASVMSSWFDHATVQSPVISSREWPILHQNIAACLAHGTFPGLESNRCDGDPFPRREKLHRGAICNVAVSEDARVSLSYVLRPLHFGIILWTRALANLQERIPPAPEKQTPGMTSGSVTCRRSSSPGPASRRESDFHKNTFPLHHCSEYSTKCAPRHHFFRCALLFGALTQYRSVKGTLLEVNDKLLVTGRYL